MTPTLPSTDNYPKCARFTFWMCRYAKVYKGFPSASAVNNLPVGDEGDAGGVPGSGRSPGGEGGNPLQYSCLENLMDRGAWRATVHGVAELDALID